MVQELTSSTPTWRVWAAKHPAHEICCSAPMLPTSAATVRSDARFADLTAIQVGQHAACSTGELYAPVLRTGAATARSMVSALWQAGQRAGPTHAPVYSTAHARQNVCPHAAPTASCDFRGCYPGGGGRKWCFMALNIWGMAKPLSQPCKQSISFVPSAWSSTKAPNGPVPA